MSRAVKQQPVTIVFTCKLTALPFPKRPQRNSTHLLPRGPNRPQGRESGGIVAAYRVGKGGNKRFTDEAGINV